MGPMQPTRQLVPHAAFLVGDSLLGARVGGSWLHAAEGHLMALGNAKLAYS